MDDWSLVQQDSNILNHLVYLSLNSIGDLLVDTTNSQDGEPDDVMEETDNSVNKIKENEHQDEIEAEDNIECCQPNCENEENGRKKM